jgi:Ca-activated chloride channel family protein
MAIDGFATPGWLGLLAGLAVLVTGYVWAQKRPLRHVLRFANLASLEHVAPRNPGWSRHLPPMLLLVALFSLTVALAGPTARVQVPRNRATVMLVIDVSLSMRSNDVTPTRLAAAQDAATSFVKAMPSTINLGLESFAGTPAVLVPPTADRESILRQIQALKLAESTATGEAIATAVTAIELFNRQIPGSEAGPPPARIVLMSDGKQTVGRDEFIFAAMAGQKHIPISTISFGTLYGTIDLQGNQVPVPVDDPSLAQVAQLSGGQFYSAQSNAALHQVYDTLGAQIGYQTIEADTGKTWFALGTLLSILAAAIALIRPQRLPA